MGSESGSELEPQLRGFIESHIDRELEEKYLKTSYRIMKRYKENGIISSVESAMLGFIISSAYSILISYRIWNNKLVTKEDRSNLIKILDTRALEIKFRINEITNL